MDRFVITARLRDGSSPHVTDLLDEGPPFDPAVVGFSRHFVFVSRGEIVFYFEGREVEWIVDDLLDDPLVSAVLAQWRPLVEGAPHIAHERFTWERGSEPVAVGQGF